MAEQDSSQERTEQPTPKRLADAKKKGQIPRSRDLNSMVITMLAAVSFLGFGSSMGHQFEAMLIDGLTLDRQDVFDVTAMQVSFAQGIFDGLILIGPFLLIMFVAALIAPISIGGWSFSWEALQPKLEKMDPIKGVKRIFSAKSLMELVKSIAKFVLITGVATAVIWVQAAEFFQLGHEPLKPALAHAASLVGWGFVLVSVALIMISVVDVPFQIWDHNRQMRMTMQEVKDEMKDTEGKPEVKGRIRQLQRQLAERRMMEAVPTADVIVTNPTHFAVALKYDQNGRGAPVVVAKGVDLIAMHIRRVGQQHDVTVLEAPPLARALYHTTELDREIPAGLYLAVAQVLAYVYQLKAVQKNGGKKPAPPKTELPDEYKKYSEVEAGSQG